VRGGVIGVYILLLISQNRNKMCPCRNGSESGFGLATHIARKFPEGCGFESRRALFFGDLACVLSCVLFFLKSYLVLITGEQIVQ
jgi:hypothetical protein